MYSFETSLKSVALFSEKCVSFEKFVQSEAIVRMNFGYKRTHHSCGKFWLVRWGEIINIPMAGFSLHITADKQKEALKPMSGH